MKELLGKINFHSGNSTPVIHQSERSECGLVCVAMIASHFGCHTDLREIRQRFSVSQQGLTLRGLVKISNAMNLNSRPVKLEMAGLNSLKLPCVLHWNFDHFVVLVEIKKAGFVIHDPALGKRTVTYEEVSKFFTGIALELWPNPGFELKEKSPRVGITSVIGNVRGAYRSAAKVLAVASALELMSLMSPLFLQLTLDNVLPAFDVDLLVMLALGFGGLMLAQEFMKLIRARMLLYFGTHLNIQLKANVFKHLISLPIEYFEKRSLGDITSRFSSIDQVQRTLTTSLLEALLDGVMSVAIVCMMFYYSVFLASISVAALALYLAIRFLWFVPLKKATEQQIIHSARQETHFLETARGIRAIKLFQRQEDRRASWLSMLVSQVNLDLKTQQIHILYHGAIGVITGIENILIIYYGVSMVIDGRFSIGFLMAFIAYKSVFNLRLTALINKGFEVKMLQVQGERLADIVLTKPEHMMEEVGGYNKTIEPSVEVFGLSYKYGDHEREVLSDISFKVSPGEFVAITGPSGCGKTTLLHLLLGIFKATSGEVLVGGVDIKKVGVENLRGLIGTVLQDDDLFSGSIADNICFFDHQPDQEWIETCARMAAIDDDIKSMSMGYNTSIGDMGSVLSGGQKQRILLARALYKRPKILLLDEATSHLDLEKEKEVNNAVANLKMTRIIVAHRPDTIAAADRVIQMRRS
ncbi:Lactococcin-G-processing and transport ATP-binding protein LagD [Pseudomonas sp. AD21]|uniref:peptidase domain-containing ABC transporter n=1 Tax=Pseudomonas sp. AD21 TaxID=396378 RepID=UPI000C852350|nr:peptidase domain-containing ABC transporter [Pseudomonas sp. AD21]PMQ13997.1 Lactococcin-G-processing and transport ATP-binding protein LagD [Pseudomonas sp. AD21]